MDEKDLKYKEELLKAMSEEMKEKITKKISDNSDDFLKTIRDMIDRDKEQEKKK